jgi:FixJ family two-component response regulator
MPPVPLKVHVVDDDDAVCSALVGLLRSAGFEAFGHQSVGDLLACSNLAQGGCVIVDAHMPGSSGLDLPELLRQRGISMPMILLTAQDTGEMRCLAKRLGFAGFFRKPVDDQALIDAVEWAISPVGPGAVAAEER